MDISVHSWQIGVKKMCISKGISYIRQMERTYRKVLHEIHPNVSKFFPCFYFYFFFQITFDLLLTSRLNTLKYTDQPIWFDFYWWSRAKQTTNSNMVWYLNMNTSTYSHWSNDVGENLPLAMHFVGGEGCYLWVLFLRDSMLMFIYHRHIFLYIIHQNNPVSKSLR